MALKITITEAHGVGYRAFLLEEADSLLIPNFKARNVKMNRKEALIVLVDGEKADPSFVNKFWDFSKIFFPVTFFYFDSYYAVLPILLA
jgi:hypothetical protein